MSSPTSLIQSLAPSYGVPTSLALALATAESSLNQGAISPKGAIGLFQLMPATAASLGVDPSNETQNIQGGLEYLQQLYNQYGNWTQALQAYNWGPGNVSSGNPVPSSVQSYASGILASAGISDDSTASDLSITSPTTDLFASVDSLDLSSLTDPSQPMFWAALGLGALVVAWVLTR
jgi:hypothetical protein